MAYDAHLAELLRDALSGHSGISEKTMFGGICWMLNGNMLAGVHKDRFMFRVGKDLEPEARERPGVRPMDITGRPMPGLVWVDPDAAIETGLQDWIAFANRFVGALPPK